MTHDEAAGLLPAYALGALDERGLALLTSTETTVERMAPVAVTASNEHGHWYYVRRPVSPPERSSSAGRRPEGTYCLVMRQTIPGVDALAGRARQTS